jgi:hypothetical protein
MELSSCAKVVREIAATKPSGDELCSCPYQDFEDLGEYLEPGSCGAGDQCMKQQERRLRAQYPKHHKAEQDRGA